VDTKTLLKSSFNNTKILEWFLYGTKISSHTILK
jgi:hypothetical protein